MQKDISMSEVKTKRRIPDQEESKKERYNKIKNSNDKKCAFSHPDGFKFLEFVLQV